MQVQTNVEKQRGFDWFFLIIAEFGICSLGHFAVMAILSLYFISSLNLPAAQAGGLMLFASLAYYFPRLFLAPLVDRLPAHLAIALALFMTSLGYLGMTVIRMPLLVMLLLLIVGAGHGTNTLLVKTLAVQSNSEKPEKTKQSPFLRYASLNTAVNLASTIGSVVGSSLLVHGSPGGVFLLAAVMYGLSGLIALALPAQKSSEFQRPAWGEALRLSLKLPGFQRALFFSFLGALLITQLFSSLPLFVSKAVSRPELLGSLFALNAILIVVGTLPLSKMVVYLRLPVSQLVLFSLLSFAAGYALLWFFPNWQAVYPAVALWTLGEMLISPALDTLIAEGVPDGYTHLAFTLNTIVSAIGEGIGNFVGVSVAGWLIISGNISTFYAIFALATLGAMVVTVFIGDRRESMIHRLLRGQSIVPTGQTQLLHPLQAPAKKTDIAQTLLIWLSAPTVYEQRNFLEVHPELIALSTGRLDEIMQQTEQPEMRTLSSRLNMLREIRNMVKTSTRTAYVNMYGGLVLELPSWLEEVKHQLTSINKEGRPDETALKRLSILQEAIGRAETENTLEPEILAELRLLAAIARIEAPLTKSLQLIEAAIPACEAALQVYTRAQYPYQYARTQIFLSLAYQNRLKGERQENLRRALACYKAAREVEGNNGDSSPTYLAATHLAESDDTPAAQGEKQALPAYLRDAMAYCQMSLHDHIREAYFSEAEMNEATQVLSPNVARRGDKRTTSTPPRVLEGSHLLPCGHEWHSHALYCSVCGAPVPRR